MIELKQVKKSYGTGESRTEVLKGIDMELETGDFAVILGASGSGKSTLLNVTSGLERPDSGSVIYDGKDITTLSDAKLTEFRRDNIGFIFQQYYLLAGMTVEKNVKMGADLAGKTDYKTLVRVLITDLILRPSGHAYSTAPNI